MAHGRGDRLRADPHDSRNVHLHGHLRHRPSAHVAGRPGDRAGDDGRQRHRGCRRNPSASGPGHGQDPGRHRKHEEYRLAAAGRHDRGRHGLLSDLRLRRERRRVLPDAVLGGRDRLGAVLVVGRHAHAGPVHGIAEGPEAGGREGGRIRREVLRRVPRSPAESHPDPRVLPGRVGGPALPHDAGLRQRGQDVLPGRHALRLHGRLLGSGRNPDRAGVIGPGAHRGEVAGSPHGGRGHRVRRRGPATLLPARGPGGAELVVCPAAGQDPLLRRSPGPDRRVRALGQREPAGSAAPRAEVRCGSERHLEVRGAIQWARRRRSLDASPHRRGRHGDSEEEPPGEGGPHGHARAREDASACLCAGTGTVGRNCARGHRVGHAARLRRPAGRALPREG